MASNNVLEFSFFYQFFLNRTNKSQSVWSDIYFVQVLTVLQTFTPLMTSHFSFDSHFPGISSTLIGRTFEFWLSLKYFWNSSDLSLVINVRCVTSIKTTTTDVFISKNKWEIKERVGYRHVKYEKYEMMCVLTAAIICEVQSTRKRARKFKASKIFFKKSRINIELSIKSFWILNLSNFHVPMEIFRTLTVSSLSKLSI